MGERTSRACEHIGMPRPSSQLRCLACPPAPSHACARRQCTARHGAMSAVGICCHSSVLPVHASGLQGDKARPDTVLYQAVDTAVKDGADLVLCDTSGRLHTNWSLMVRGSAWGGASERLGWCMAAAGVGEAGMAPRAASCRASAALLTAG